MVLEKTLESSSDCTETQPVNPKEISPEYSLEGLMLKLKFQYFGQLTQRTDSFEKTPDDYSFSNESTLPMRWPKYWSFSFRIISYKDIPGLISFRLYWLDLLEVQGTLKSLLQHHSSKASILRRSAFFTVQLSHPYMTTGKTIALKAGGEGNDRE